MGERWAQQRARPSHVSSCKQGYGADTLLQSISDSLHPDRNPRLHSGEVDETWIHVVNLGARGGGDGVWNPKTSPVCRATKNACAMRMVLFLSPDAPTTRINNAMRLQERSTEILRGLCKYNENSTRTLKRKHVLQCKLCMHT